MGIHHRARVLAAALGCALAVSACGSSAPSSAAAGGDGEIVIGNVGTYSGPQSSTLGPSREVIEAWAEDLNKNGGINGRQVKLVLKDDGGNATKALTATKELIGRDEVVAIVGQMSLVDTAWAQAASAAGVPVIGGQPFNTPFLTDKNFFPSGTNSIARNYGIVAEAKRMGSKFALLYCAEAPACEVGVGVTKALGKDVGVTVPVAQSVSAAAPNYTAPCQAVKDSGAQSYRVGQASSVALRIMDACKAQGVTAVPVATGGTADETWLTHDSAQGAVNVDLNFPYFDGSVPATKAYQDLLDEYSLGYASGASGTYTYAGAKLFQKAAESIGDGEVTSQALKDALYAMDGETLGGISPPLRFTEGEPSLINCWFLSVIEDEKWTAPQGLETSCAPDDLVESQAAKLR